MTRQPGQPGRGAVLGAVGLAVAVACGAFGAHLLAGRLDVRALGLWETAVRYLVVGAVGLLATGMAAPSRSRAFATTALAAGAVIFAGTVGALALGGPRWLGAITPLGGLGLIAGALALARALARNDRLPAP